MTHGTETVQRGLSPRKPRSVFDPDAEDEAGHNRPVTLDLIRRDMVPVGEKGISS